MSRARSARPGTFAILLAADIVAAAGLRLSKFKTRAIGRQLDSTIAEAVRFSGL
jgi:hypothetical protein